MKIWNFAKDIMLASSITTIYAIGCRESFHKITTVHCAVILIATFLIILGLLFTVEDGIKKLEDERRKKRGRKNG